MGAETPKDVDRTAIEEHAQRTLEQIALRKVRNTLDGIEAAELGRRRMVRYVLIACALLAALGLWFFLGLIFSGRDLPHEPPMKLPRTLQQKQ